MKILEAAPIILGALIIFKKMDLGVHGSYGVMEGGAGYVGDPTEKEIITIENTAQIAASKMYTLANSSYFTPALDQQNKREFTNLAIVNLSVCPINIVLEADPRKYFTLTASSEFTLMGNRVLRFKNLAINNRSAVAAIEANQLIITMW
jgi:hypothetical protein